jgi:DNA-binding beta-propeller fold protein YncE
MRSRKTAAFGVAFFATTAIAFGAACAQDVNSAPNGYTVVDNWAQLPPGRPWGMAIGLDIDRDGRSVWVFDRCGGKTCTGSPLAPLQKFDASGKLVASLGAGMFNWPHGLFVDREGNIWVTDAKGEGGKGHVVVKFGPDGKVLMTLGTPGVAGADETHFNAPSDVVVAPSGDIFVADGHGDDTNARIVKFSKDGKFLLAWGRKGAGPGEFDTPHGLAMDSAGRVFVADRMNNRIQIFDQNGKFLAEWRQFGRPSGIFIDKHDMIYVADSQSGEKFNKPFRQGIRIGSVKDGHVTAFIDKAGTPEMPEGVAADDEGNVFGGFTANMTVKKFVHGERRAGN